MQVNARGSGVASSIPGISFDLFVGRTIEPFIRRTCTLRSQENLIYLTEHVEKRAVRDMLKAFETSRPSANLRRAFFT